MLPTHYFTSALRGIARMRASTALSIVMLALGLCCFIVASSVVDFWSRADRYFKNANRTFAVTTEIALQHAADGSGVTLSSTHWLAQYLKLDFPEVEQVARVTLLNENSAVSDGEGNAIRVTGYSADAEFLEIFDLPFVARVDANPLAKPRSVVLTEEAAIRLYGDRNALGRRIILGNQWECVVTGVVGRIREPSHMGRSVGAPLRFDMIASRDVYESVVQNAAGADTTKMPEDWLWTPAVTYVMFRDPAGASQRLVEGQLAGFVARHVPQAQRQTADYRLGLLPVSDMLGVAAGGAGFLRQTGMSVSTLLLLLGALVLVAACTNYANLAVAQSERKAREVGVRKALGARPGQIAAQYQYESLILTSIALAAALAGAWAVLPIVNAKTGIDLRLSLLADYRSIAFLLGLLVVTTAIAGSYPAFVLSRVKPVVSLRVGRRGTGRRSMSRVLVGAQFAVASFLLIVLSVSYLQNAAMRRTGVALSGDRLLVVENYAELTKVQHTLLHDRLLQLPDVESGTAIGAPPWTTTQTVSLSRFTEAERGVQQTFVYQVGYDFLATFRIPLLAGRDFSNQFGDAARLSSPDQPRAIVIDGILAGKLGFDAPESAVGQSIFLHRAGENGGKRVVPYEVIGVAQNQPLNVVGSSGAAGSAYLYTPSAPFHVVRLSGNHGGNAVREVETLLHELVPTVRVNWRFVDGYFQRAYESFARIIETMSTLAGIALLIATVGLVALSSSVINHSLNELGIRKAMGATPKSVVGLLLGRFARPLLVGSLLAWPFAYVAVSAYLRLFIDPIPLSPVPFLVCLLFNAAVGCLLVLSQTWNVARRRPADILRAE